MPWSSLRLDRPEGLDRCLQLARNRLQLAHQLGVDVEVAFVLRQIAFGMAAVQYPALRRREP